VTIAGTGFTSALEVSFDATPAKTMGPIVWFGYFVEADGLRILCPRTTHQPGNAGPRDGAVTHGTRCTA